MQRFFTKKILILLLSFVLYQSKKKHLDQKEDWKENSSFKILNQLLKQKFYNQDKK